jgi:hypothetical protein
LVGDEPGYGFFTNLDEEFTNQNKSLYEKECFSFDGTNYHNDFNNACL